MHLSYVTEFVNFIMLTKSDVNFRFEKSREDGGEIEVQNETKSDRDQRLQRSLNGLHTRRVPVTCSTGIRIFLKTVQEFRDRGEVIG